MNPRRRQFPAAEPTLFFQFIYIFVTNAEFREDLRNATTRGITLSAAQLLLIIKEFWDNLGKNQPFIPKFFEHKKKPPRKHE